MEYVYGAMLLHAAGKDVTEADLTKVLKAPGLKVDDARVKALVSALEDVDIEEVIKQSAFAQAAAPQAGAPAGGEAAAAEGFFYAPDPASQIACTLAGNIATNASGPRCLKYGTTTEHILGIKMVMMDGEIIDIGGQHLDAPGYDLLGLLLGSEGQFGVVTEATVRLLRSPEDRRPMLLGFGSTEAAIGCVGALVGAGIVPVALEFMDKQAILACENFGQADCPTDVENLLIVELEGSDDEVDGLTPSPSPCGRGGQQRGSPRDEQGWAWDGAGQQQGHEAR